MLKISLRFILFFFLLVIGGNLFAQQKQDSTSSTNGTRIDMRKNNEDTLIVKGNNKADTTGKNLLALDTTVKKHDPKIATFRSAVLPGWGQAYNRKYWKIPIIYGALGTTAYIFFYNKKTYKALRRAVVLKSDTDTANDIQIDPRFRAFSLESIRTDRNIFRQNIDYSVLFFLVFWGLNVVDATVDGHLKAFDVSPNITLKITPGFNYLTNNAGLSFVFSFKDKHSKVLTSLL